MANIVIAKNLFCRSFKCSVGFSFDGVNGDRPAALPGQNDFVVPVGTLDQPNGNREALLSCPLKHKVNIPVAVFQVDLHRQAQVGVIPEFRIAAQAAV